MMRMDARPLDSELLLHYYDILIEQNPSIDILKDFLYNITSMIDRENNYLPGGMITDIMEPAGNGISDSVIEFMKEYAAYLASISALLQTIREASSEEDVIHVQDVLLKIYFALFDLKGRDFADMVELIRGYAGICISNSLDMLNIQGPQTIEGLEKKLKGNTDPILSKLIAGLMEKIEFMFVKPDEVDHAILSYVFFYTVVITANMMAYIEFDPLEKLFGNGVMKSFK
ncbi:MAG: hypothetical protein ACOCX9_08580 [Spirochaetota bacterium]